MFFNVIGYIQTSVCSPAKRRLAGRVQVNGSGAKKRIGIFKRGTLEYVASGMSNADGTWELRGLSETLTGEDVLVVHLDDTRSFDPIAFDNVTLVE